MSHISQMKTAIKLPVGQPDKLAVTMGLLHQAALVVASQYPQLNEGEIAQLPEPARLAMSEGPTRQYHFDWYWNKVPAELAVFVPQLPRGMGIAVGDDGTVSFVGDFWGVSQWQQTLQNQIVQTYVTIATKTAMERLGYATSLVDLEGGSLAVKGVAYA